MGCEKGCGKAREMVMWAKDKPSREEQKRRWVGGGGGTHNSPVVADGKQEKERREELGLGEQEGEAQEGLHRNTHSKQQL